MPSQRFERGHALLVGVGRTAYEPWSLETTSRDAELVKLTLTDPRRCGYPARNITLLTDGAATRENMLSALSDLHTKVTAEQDSTVVVFYSGHGWTTHGGRYCLILSDTGPDDLESTALWADDLNDGLRRLDPARLLVVLDTCHAGGMAEAKALVPGFVPKAPPDTLTQKLAEGLGRVVLSSCRGSESSWLLEEQGVSLFTHHFIAALNGAGSPPAADRVRVLELGGYVADAVTKAAEAMGKTQTPTFKADTENFPLAAKQPAPAARVEEAVEPAALPGSPSGGHNRAGRDLIQVGQGSVITGASHGAGWSGRRDP